MKSILIAGTNTGGVIAAVVVLCRPVSDWVVVLWKPASAAVVVAVEVGTYSAPLKSRFTMVTPRMSSSESPGIACATLSVLCRYTSWAVSPMSSFALVRSLMPGSCTSSLSVPRICMIGSPNPDALTRRSMDLLSAFIWSLVGSMFAPVSGSVRTDWYLSSLPPRRSRPSSIPSGEPSAPRSKPPRLNVLNASTSTAAVIRTTISARGREYLRTCASGL